MGGSDVAGISIGEVKNGACRRYNKCYTLGMTKVKVTGVGNSVGIILPKEILAKLRVSKGDFLTVSETPLGVSLSALDEKKHRQLEIAEQIMRENRNMLRKLGE